MFTTSVLTSSYPFSKGNKSALQSIVTKNESCNIKQLWFIPGHLLISVNNGLRLLTFDVLPQALKNIPEEPIGLDCPYPKPYPLLDILPLKESKNTFLAIQVNGKVESWKFNINDGAWGAISGQSFNLYAGVLEIVSASINENIKAIFWCQAEKTSNNKTRYSVYYRTYDADSTQWTKARIKPSKCILKDCVPCEFYSLKNSTVILPCEPKGLLYIWCLSEKKVVINHLVGGYFGELEEKDEPFNFYDINADYLNECIEWKNEAESIFHTFDPVLQNIQVIRPNGSRYLIKDENDFVPLPPLPWCHDTNSSKNLKWFIYYLALCLVDGCKIRFFEKKSGVLLQEINTQYFGEVLGVWNTMTTIQNAGFYSVKDINGKKEKQLYTIKMAEKSDWPRTPNTVNVLIDIGDFRLAIMMCVEAITKNDPDSHFYLEKLQEMSKSPKGCQSSALLLAAIEKCKGNESCQITTAQGQEDLLTYLTSLQDKPKTPLKETLEPEVNKVFELEKKFLDFKMGRKLPFLNISSVSDTVGSALEEIHHDYTGTMSLLTSLAQNDPGAVLDGFQKYLGYDPEDKKSNYSSWRELLFHEDFENRTGAHNPLFEFVCILFYQEKPECLTHFVNSASGTAHSTGVTYPIHRTKRQYDRAVRCLPEPTHSSNISEAAKAKADLILLSSFTNAPHLSLQLLIKYQLWTEAIELVNRHDGDDNLNKELFHTLLRATVEEKEPLAKYASELGKIIPSTMSTLHILELLGNKFESQPEEPSFTTEDNDQLQAIIPFLDKLFLRRS